MDPELLILSSLAGGAKHGYAIMQEIAVFAGVELGPGTLYTAITRLVEQGWIEPMGASGRQRPYRVTPAGSTVTAAPVGTYAPPGRSFGLRRLRTV